MLRQKFHNAPYILLISMLRHTVYVILVNVWKYIKKIYMKRTLAWKEHLAYVALEIHERTPFRHQNGTPNIASGLNSVSTTEWEVNNAILRY